MQGFRPVSAPCFGFLSAFGFRVSGLGDQRPGVLSGCVREGLGRMDAPAAATHAASRPTCGVGAGRRSESGVRRSRRLLTRMTVMAHSSGLRNVVSLNMVACVARRSTVASSRRCRSRSASTSGCARCSREARAGRPLDPKAVLASEFGRARLFWVEGKPSLP